jgi:hypothetical protein
MKRKTEKTTKKMVKSKPLPILSCLLLTIKYLNKNRLGIKAIKKGVLGFFNQTGITSIISMITPIRKYSREVVTNPMIMPVTMLSFSRNFLI